MSIATVKVSDKGQIAIPQSVRESLGIEKGDDLVMLQVDGKIVLEKSKDTEKKLKDEFKDILKFSEKSLKKVWDNKSDDIWGSYLK
ncbi:MAG: AbrB/MazE/SpoVT family DNA-binding domain-containing protein [Candidatus Woesearchaeota archaeon]